MLIYKPHIWDSGTGPSMKKGVARILDINCQLDNYRIDKNSLKSDAYALKKDWHTVGRDIMDAIEKYGKQSGK